MKRTAFTVMDLLIVIAVVGILIALLLSALQRAHEAANRTSCTNNLRQLGFALLEYHDAQGCFPPGLALGGDNGLLTDISTNGHSGFIPLLAYLDQGSVASQFDPNAIWYEPPNSALVPLQIKTFYCPSNRLDGVIDTSFMVPFAGRPLPNVAASDYLLCKGSSASLCEVTQVPPATRGAFDVNSATRLADITDGTSNTFAMGEGAGGNPLYGIRRYYSDTTPASLFPDQSSHIDQSWCGGPMATQALNTLGLLGGSCLGVTAERGGQAEPFDEPMNYPLGLAALAYNNAGCTNSGTAPGTFDTVSGFRSVHPGGCNFLFCDGSVHFLVQSVAPDTYRALSTIAGGEVPGDW